MRKKTFICLSLLILIFLSGCLEKSSDKSKINIHVSVGSDIVKNIEMPKGSTALDAFSSVASLDTKESSVGTYIEGVNSKKQGNSTYWIFYINNKIASVGVSAYTLKNNDSISLKFEQFS